MQSTRHYKWVTIDRKMILHQSQSVFSNYLIGNETNTSVPVSIIVVQHCDIMFENSALV